MRRTIRVVRFAIPLLAVACGPLVGLTDLPPEEADSGDATTKGAYDGPGPDVGGATDAESATDAMPTSDAGPATDADAEPADDGSTLDGGACPDGETGHGGSCTCDATVCTQAGTVCQDSATL